MNSHEAAHAHHSVDILALTALLLRKGIITPEEHAAAIAAETEAQAKAFIREGEPK